MDTWGLWGLDQRVAAAPAKIYRGLQVDLPPELHQQVHQWNQPAMDTSEVGQHLKIGPALLDHLQGSHPLKNHWNNPRDLSLGSHWTTRKDFAEKAAQQGGAGGKGSHSIVLEADHPGEEHLDTKRTGTGGQWSSEEEHTLLPGTPLNITSVNWNGNEVLHDSHYEKNQEADYGVPYAGGPRRSTAANTLDSINPTGGLFVDYRPEDRTGPHGSGVTTLDKVHGSHPDEPVTIYRGAPHHQTEINPGDFVTDDPTLAKMYGPNVLTKQVPKSHVATDPDEWEGGEHIYSPRTARRSMTAAVTLFTKPNCPQCDMTKKQLVKHNIPHEVRDVTTDPAAHDFVTGDLGYSAAPVVHAGDDNHWSGFRPDRIKALIGT